MDFVLQVGEVGDVEVAGPSDLQEPWTAWSLEQESKECSTECSDEDVHVLEPLLFSSTPLSLSSLRFLF